MTPRIRRHASASRTTGLTAYSDRIYGFGDRNAPRSSPRGSGSPPPPRSPRPEAHPDGAALGAPGSETCIEEFFRSPVVTLARLLQQRRLVNLSGQDQAQPTGKAVRSGLVRGVPGTSDLVASGVAPRLRSLAQHGALGLALGPAESAQAYHEMRFVPAESCLQGGLRLLRHTGGGNETIDSGTPPECVEDSTAVLAEPPCCGLGNGSLQSCLAALKVAPAPAADPFSTRGRGDVLEAKRGGCIGESNPQMLRKRRDAHAASQSLNHFD